MGSKMHEELIGKVHDYVKKLFEENSVPENFYHNFEHTKGVVHAAKRIGKAEGVNDSDIELLLIAAWFHDVGCTDKCKGHEDISKSIANKFLESQNYPKDKIVKVVSMIEATRIPQKPKNILEEIICDADLHHLGTKECKEKGDLLRLELERRMGMIQSDEDWFEFTAEFFRQHNYFTKYAKENYGVQKNINLLKIEKRIKKLKKKNKDIKLKEAKLEIEKQKIASKKDQEKRADRGIETMFRNTMRTHVSFSSMADNKANIMISVNTLVLTIIVSIMVRKLDTNPQLIIPTALLTITCLVALVYAILVTRPKVTTGRFTKEDINRKKANLLFFGNFYNMNLEDFSWGMKQMMNDKDYLYESMTKDFYYLGQVLGTKYKQLRICYTIFMYGVIISVIAYAIAFILYPHGADIGPLIE